jgi:solute carrier family 25 citrate transporter 1
MIGGFCGFLEITTTYPLEYVKNSMQLQPNRFRSPIHAFQVNVANHGPLVLYKGIPSWWLFAFPRNAVRFTLFDILTQGLNIENDFTRDAVAGVGAGFVEAYVALVPCQNLSIKMTHDANLPLEQQKYSRSFFSGAAAIFRDNGIRGMFAGALPTVIKNSMNMMIRFPGFHYLSTTRIAQKRQAKDCDDDGGTNDLSSLNAIELMLCGGVAGAVSAVASHPVDVVKANMMGLNAAKYGTPTRAATVIWKEYGFQGFYVGLSPRITRVFIEVGMLFTIFEKITKMFESATRTT